MKGSIVGRAFDVRWYLLRKGITRRKVVFPSKKARARSWPLPQLLQIRICSGGKMGECVDRSSRIPWLSNCLTVYRSQIYFRINVQRLLVYLRPPESSCPPVVRNLHPRFPSDLDETSESRMITRNPVGR